MGVYKNEVIEENITKIGNSLSQVIDSCNKILEINSGSETKFNEVVTHINNDSDNLLSLVLKLRECVICEKDFKL